jgi:hypothetical protein
MEVIVIAIVSIACIASNMLCFLIGARVGQKVVKGEEVELPKINPMEVYREQQERREAQREIDRIDMILRNIDNYDGTPNGQEEVR